MNFNVVVFLQKMWERLTSMRQEHALAANQCECIGSSDKPKEQETEAEDSVSQLAEAVQEMVQDGIGEVM